VSDTGARPASFRCAFWRETVARMPCDSTTFIRCSYGSIMQALCGTLAAVRGQPPCRRVCASVCCKVVVGEKLYTWRMPVLIQAKPFQQSQHGVHGSCAIGLVLCRLIGSGTARPCCGPVMMRSASGTTQSTSLPCHSQQQRPRQPHSLQQQHPQPMAIPLPHSSPPARLQLRTSLEQQPLCRTGTPLCTQLLQRRGRKCSSRRSVLMQQQRCSEQQ
jgi:hypothetical protein